MPCSNTASLLVCISATMIYIFTSDLVFQNFQIQCLQLRSPNYVVMHNEFSVQALTYCNAEIQNRPRSKKKKKPLHAYVQSGGEIVSSQHVFG